MRGISEKLKRILFILIGTLFLGIGCIGIVIPVLPTTPFLLLAAACYLRGSERLHHWMINNRVFGEFIRNYMEGRGIRPIQKVFTLIFLWLMILLSIFYVVDNLLLRILMFLIAAAVSVHILMLPDLIKVNLS